MTPIVPRLDIENPKGIAYSGYELLDVRPDDVLSAAEYVLKTRLPRIVDTDGTVYEADGSLSEDQDL